MRLSCTFLWVVCIDIYIYINLWGTTDQWQEPAGKEVHLSLPPLGADVYIYLSIYLWVGHNRKMVG